jgi:aryl-alcohol dehydrogenase-like predicted oxidoreductase
MIMQYVELGRTGLRVSRLCLGTMNFGVEASEKDSFAIMDRALELGINFYDTADRYGKPQGLGYTEEIVGRWLAQGGRRERIVLATKAYGPMGAGPNNRGNSAYHLRRACQDSLRRLQTDHIDLYQTHHIDHGEIAPHHVDIVGRDVQFVNPPQTTPGAPWEEVWQAMEQLIREGKITYVGSSNHAAWNIVQGCETAKARHLLGLVSEQSVYNLTKRYVELEVLPACRAYGVGFICWSPLAGGMLAGAMAKAAQGRRAGLKLSEAQQSQLQAYEDLCRELGEPPAAVALAWLLSNPVVTAPIVGPRTVEQLESALRALEITLSADTLQRLDAIFPGLGGEAPKAYAW